MPETPPKRKLISFEGVEASGKTTQVARLEAHFRSVGASVLALREPGGTYIGDRIRYLLQNDPEVRNMSPEAETLLYEASRAQLVAERILPALNEGSWVLCDRFFDSTTAYQGAAHRILSTRRISFEDIRWLNHFAVGGLIPELTFFLDLPVEDMQKRRSYGFGHRPDRIERESPEFFGAVAQIYRHLAAQEPQRFVVVEARQDEDCITAYILQRVLEHFYPQ